MASRWLQSLIFSSLKETQMKNIKLTTILIIWGRFALCQSILITPNSNQNQITNFGPTSFQQPLFLGIKAGGTHSSKTSAPAESSLMNLGGMGRISSSQWASSNSASIEFKTTQVYTPNSGGSDIIFGTTPNGTNTLTNRMWIKESGNVGINDNDPQSRLHITNSGIANLVPADNTLLTVESSSFNAISLLANTETGLLFGSTLGNRRGRILYNPSTDVMSFYTANANRMTISNSKVGINTTTPEATLDVFGDIRFSKKKEIEHVGLGCTTCPMIIQNLDRQNASVIRFFGGNTIQLYSIAGGVDGMIIYIYVLSQTNLMIMNNNGTTGNTISTGTGNNFAIGQGGGLTLVYDADGDGFWRVIGYTQ